MLSALFVALSTAATVSALPLVKIGTVTPSLLPNATQYNTSVVWYEMNGRAGACGNFSQDSDKVVGLPLEFYSKLGQVSPYCGEYVVVTTPQNVSVVAKVEDASTLNNTLSVSVGTWEALNGSAVGLTEVNWRRANETEIAAAKKAQSAAPSSTSSWVAPSSTSSWVAPSSTTTYAAASSASSASKEWKAPVASSSSSASVEHSSVWTPSSSAVASSSAQESSSWSEPKKQSSTSTWVAPSSTSTWTPPSSTWTPSTSTWSSPAAKSSSTSTWSPEPTTTWTPPATTTTTQAPQQTQAQRQQSSASYGSYSGQATWFTQDGNPGSCGNYNSDSTPLVALSYSQVDGGSHCGQYVNIRNTATGQSVTAVVADTCPGCGYGSLDLSLGAFDQIGSRDQGVLPISWSFA